MCGIGGLILHGDETPSEELLRLMGDAMRARGPDDEGVFRARHIGLVHRRLSIRDLSPAGRCPMSAAEGRIQVTFNGEIYNWRELRRELEIAGYRFNSQSDTEVIANGYDAWGDGVIARLDGMFAIGIWDARQRRLLLARDRTGEKPLFYCVLTGGLAFASTLEALSSAQGTRTIDPVALACYLSHSFIPSSHTIWDGVQTLPPAHVLTVEVGRAPLLSRYWDFPRKPPRYASRAACETSVEAALDDSVVRCLDADVELGVLLSGGVDSSLVAALAARHQPSIKTFSLGFKEADFSELAHARRVADHLKLTHHTLVIDDGDVLDCLPHLVRQYGQPFGDASAVPSYLVARFARESVKVCLSGDGADESFGGYWRVQSGVYAARYGAIVPRGLRTHVVPKLAGTLGFVGSRWAAMNQLSLSEPGAAYTNSASWYSMLAQVAGPRLRPALGGDLGALRVGKALARPEASIGQKILYDDFQVQLPDAYLTKVDVASMAASLEVRAPFLEQRMIEMAWSLPDSMKLNWGRRKWLLKRIASRLVPADVIYRPKMGFAMPLEQWFRGRLGDGLEQLMNASAAVEEGWIDRDCVRRSLDAHRNGQNNATRLWLILWLEHWFRLVARSGSPT